jgi:CRISPR-associated protein Cmr2
MSNDHLWQTKLAARLHDPAEKALVLLRDPAGHENGSSRALKRLLGLDSLPAENIDPDNDEVLARVLFKKGLPVAMYSHVQRADWWAAAADRPQFPMQEITVTTNTGERKTLAVAPWARVNWAKRPVLIHPLTGETYDLGSLAETEIEAIKQRSFNHFLELLIKLGAQDAEAQDWRKILLAYWRFGPELRVTNADCADNQQLGALWEALPADTRIPDHSIWDHLDLTSAFAGAFAADPKNEAALLALSIGPVQPFIAAARKVEDLWAGSHLLSRLAWEAMRPLCEALGPDAILFPRLRGIPQVDLWLRDQMGLPDELFAGCEWMKDSTDANPLFAAALPNRFVAVVPASQARTIAEHCTHTVREWLKRLGDDVVARLLHEADFNVETTPTPYEQMKEQLAGFPEVYWAAVPFSLIRCRDKAKQRDLEVADLLGAMAPFFGATQGKPCGFLDTPAWQVLGRELDWDDGTTFYAPNPGVLYPAVYDLAERLLAAAKAARPFTQSRQEGWRDSLTGETEWLTTDRAQLGKSYRQQTDTLWAGVAKSKPAWAKKGEHLGALSAIKRLWPTVFAEEAGKALAAGERGEQLPVGRFVVSTHTMALAHQLEQWLKKGGSASDFDAASAPAVALPRKLLRHKDKKAIELAKRLPGLLEAARDADDDVALERAEQRVRKTLGSVLGKDEAELETYYALIMMDGDRMGAILSGDGTTNTAITYRKSFHPEVRHGFDQHAERHDLIRRYGEQKRPVSPNRHLAISGALNDFSQTAVRHVVEEEHLGRLIYAGGDDVLAMLPVADMLSCMQRLRHAYSGTLPDDEAKDWGELRKDRNRLHCKGGFAYLNGRLMRMMGRNATASCGAVIAHHQAPLSAVLRELRAAEKRAKTEGGRNAFSITVIKRSGGALHLTAKWGEPLALLNELRRYLSADETSRRAVYRALGWLRDLPDPKENPDMLESLLAYQLARQSGGDTAEKVPQLARRLTALASSQGDARAWLSNFLCVAEFLARETRAVQVTNGDRT